MPTAAVSITRLLRGAPAEVRDDALAIEEPLEIRIGGRAATITMRTPGHDEELVRGFLFSEGLIRRASDLDSMERPRVDPARPEERGNVLDVTLAPSLVALGTQPFQRNFYASSSCGVCGKSSLAAIEVKAAPISSDLAFSRETIAAFPTALRAAQSTFDATGGLHAAALFDERGALLVLREDVGRHNAVDKVIGWALARDLVPASRLGLQVSGRTSFEILQKAIVAGIPIVSAVSAPSSLAVSLARRFGVTLLGFVRDGSMNVYSAPERITW